MNQEQTNIRETAEDAQAKTLEKLRKLLRLSESANEHEAALALARAQELAIKHRIELATVNAYTETPTNDERIGRMARTYPRRSLARNYISWIIEKHFNVQIVYSGPKKVWMIGTRSDVDFARYVWDFLEIEFKRLFNVAADYNGWMGNDRRARTSYYYGLYQGLSKKLNDEKLTAEREAISETSRESSRTIGEVANAYALAIRKNELAVKSAVKVFFPRLRRSSSRISIGSNDAMNAGQRDGARINLNRPIAGHNGPVSRLN